MSRNPQKDLIRRFIKIIIEEDPDFEGRRDTTVEEWIMMAESRGIDVDFSDDNFLAWFVGKCRQEFSSEKVASIARRFFSMNIMDPDRNKLHAAILYALISEGPLGDREWYTLVADYAIRNFPDSDFGKVAITFAKAFGVTNCEWHEIYGTDPFELIPRDHHAQADS